MKKSMLVVAFASAIALLFAGPASAVVTRTQNITYNFHSVGQGDVGGFCFFHDPASQIPPQLHSCIESVPAVGETHVDISVRDADGAAVYFSVQQDNNPNFAAGCGSVGVEGGVVQYPVVDQGPGGTPAEPVTIFPWAGPGANPSFNPPGVSPCAPGSVSTGGGTATLVWHDN
jgi:hypothetical protein